MLHINFPQKFTQGNYYSQYNLLPSSKNKTDVAYFRIL